MSTDTEMRENNYLGSWMYRKGLAVLPSVETLSPLVTRILGQNPGPKTLQGTNTYLVGRPPNVVLVDTGEANNERYIEHLSCTLQSTKLQISSIIITHMHPDHIGGCSAVLEMLQSTQPSSPSVPVYKYLHKDDSEYLSSDFITPLEDNQTLPIGPDLTLKVLHTPGHTDDSISLYLEEESAIFSGDTILGGSSGEFSNYTSYIASLFRLKEMGLETVYPGHGVVETGSVVEKYISHRQKRENMVLQCLRDMDDIVTVEQLAAKVYENDNLQDGVLVESARRIVELILEKLFRDETVKVCKGGRWAAVKYL